MKSETEVGGVRCGEVLGELSDFTDGSLAPERRDAFNVHLRGCPRCARFGAVWTKVLARLADRAGGFFDGDEQGTR